MNNLPQHYFNTNKNIQFVICNMNIDFQKKDSPTFTLVMATKAL